MNPLPRTHLMDLHGRRLTYLRLSVTDRCNLRCTYCAPQKNFSWTPHENILTYEEILLVARVLGGMGLGKIRLTGGEPLVRRGIARLARGLVETPGIKEVCLTTNGVMLSRHADALFRAGVRHVNISLDTLDPGLFEAITGRDLLHRVWEGITRVLDLGFGPVKLNMVVMKGVNDHEIKRMAALSLEYPIQVRFIEFMPVGNDSRWSEDRLLPCSRIKQEVEAGLGPLKPIEAEPDAGPAAVFSLEHAPGTIGFISPLSHHFCNTCNRLRLTADGRLRLCLFSDREVDVRSRLRQGHDTKELESFFRRAVQMKPKGYKELGYGRPSCLRTMSSIGG